MSYVLLTLARERGIPVRHVGLFGHVVMEAWYDDDWHLFDPDLEVAPRDGAGGVLSVEELAQSPDLLEQYYGVSIRRIVRVEEQCAVLVREVGGNHEVCFACAHDVHWGLAGPNRWAFKRQGG